MIVGDPTSQSHDVLKGNFATALGLDTFVFSFAVPIAETWSQNYRLIQNQCSNPLLPISEYSDRL